MGKEMIQCVPASKPAGCGRETRDNERAAGQGGMPHPSPVRRESPSCSLMRPMVSVAKPVNITKIASEFPKVQQ